MDRQRLRVPCRNVRAEKCEAVRAVGFSVVQPVLAAARCGLEGKSARKSDKLSLPLVKLVQSMEDFLNLRKVLENVVVAELGARTHTALLQQHEPSRTNGLQG